MRIRVPAPLILVLVLAPLFLALAGCMSEPVGPSPEQIGERFYGAVMNGDFEAAADLYVQEVPSSVVVSRLENLRERMGALESYRMTDLVSYIAAGGTRYTLRYTVSYSKGHATEGLLLFHSAEDGLVRIEEYRHN